MSEPAIIVRGVSKKYRLFESPSDRLKEALHPFSKRYHREFWALKDVSFEVSRGQTIGIIGRNGSGKSTLLQIIAGVMKPTNGEVVVNGRVSALLELGAGFNPEFTGRDNALLNGAIMGIERNEMLDRLDAIREFAGIGEFFDQPIKTYSSGMYARLAFACAINVDPDVLIVDETLSVGDAKFQNKCFMKFREFQDAGKTLLLVSHSVEAIVRNTGWAVLLEAGRIVFQGEPKEAVNRYFELLYGERKTGTSVPGDQIHLSDHGTTDSVTSEQLSETAVAVQTFLNQPPGKCEERKSYNPMEFRFGDGGMEVIDYLIVSGGTVDPIKTQGGASANVYVKVVAHEYIVRPSVGCAVKSMDGIYLYGCNTMMREVRIPSLLPGQYAVVCFSMNFSVAGRDIFLDLGCGDWSTIPVRVLDHRRSVIHMQVENTTVFHGLVDLGGGVELLRVSTSEV